MNFLAILGFSLIITILLVMIRRDRPELATLLSIAAAAIILLAMLQGIQAILTTFESMALKTRMNIAYLKEIIKIVGFAYLAGFGSQICRDAGENGMATKIELAGKIMILLTGLPIMFSILDLVLKFF